MGVSVSPGRYAEVSDRFSSTKGIKAQTAAEPLSINSESGKKAILSFVVGVVNQFASLDVHALNSARIYPGLMDERQVEILV